MQRVVKDNRAQPGEESVSQDTHSCVHVLIAPQIYKGDHTVESIAWRLVA